MTFVERFFALKELFPFREMDDADVGVIAETARLRVYRAGELFCAAGQCLQRFHVVVKGEVRCSDGLPAPRVMGVGSILFGMPVNGELRADAEDGAVCLVIGKAHFFTIVYQCPGLLCGLLRMRRHEAGRQSLAERKPHGTGR